MGRDENAADGDASKFLYPAMQSQDIHSLGIDVALGGMDQRKAHMYMRDVSDRLKLVKATCIHTPIIPSLKSISGRMDSSVIANQNSSEKMSKSDPKSAILLHHGPSRIKKMMRGAHLDPFLDESPVHEIVQHILLVTKNSLIINRKQEYGGPLKINSIEEVRKMLAKEELHPLDYKEAVATELSEMLEPLREKIQQEPESFKALEKLVMKHS